MPDQQPQPADIAAAISRIGAAQESLNTVFAANAPKHAQASTTQAEAMAEMSDAMNRYIEQRAQELTDSTDKEVAMLYVAGNLMEACAGLRAQPLTTASSDNLIADVAADTIKLFNPLFAAVVAASKAK